MCVQLCCLRGSTLSFATPFVNIVRVDSFWGYVCIIHEQVFLQVELLFFVSTWVCQFFKTITVNHYWMFLACFFKLILSVEFFL